jgi:hypothetical protein
LKGLGKGYTRAGILSLFRNSDRAGWYFPLQKISLVENRFLQAGKGAENTKEKSRQCFRIENLFDICRGLYPFA